MAETDLLTRTTREKFLPVLKENIFNKMKLFKALNAAGRVKEWAGGTSLLWDVIGARHQSIGTFKQYSTIANQPNNPVVQATLNSGNYVGTVAISKEEMWKNRGNAERLIDIMKVQMQNCESTMKEQIATDTYANATGVAANGHGVLVGLPGMVDTDNTYANINRSTAGNEFWQANEVTTVYTEAELKDSTDAGFLPKLMFAMYTNAEHDGAPTTIFTTDNLYNIYNLIASTNNKRITSETNDLGFMKSDLFGLPIVNDKYCTTKHMYFLNLNAIELHVFPGCNFDFDTVEGTGSIWLQPTDQLAKLAHIVFMGQLKCDPPRENGRYTALGS